MSPAIFSINPLFSDEKFSHSFRECYQSNSLETFTQNGCKLLKFPFSCCTFSDFLALREPQSNINNNQQLVDELERQTRKLPFTNKRNDLFTFSQSVDVVNLELENGKLMEDVGLLTEFRHFLLSDVLPWLEKLTGIQLEHGKVDLTSSIYGSGDVLLCHDDELEGRRIAFIWYMVPEDWDSAKDGGFLQLFSCQTDKEAEYHPDPRNPPARLNPWKVVASLPPRRNLFAFFEVSAYSFHQVTEILGQKERLSLHGWFHGPGLPRPAERDHPSRVPRISPTHIEESLVYRWINPIYIDMSQQAKIRRRFVRASEIQLVNFLKDDQWKELNQALSSLDNSESWLHVGPFNRKNFHALRWSSSCESESLLPDVLRQLHRLFASEAMQVILSDLTGIRFHPSSIMLDAKTPDIVDTIPPEAKRLRTDSAVSQIDSLNGSSLTEPQLRRWRPTDYTLLADTELAIGGWRLECVLHLLGYGKPTAIGQKKKKQLTESATSACPSSSGDHCSQCWDASWGGQIIYIAKDEEEPLLTVQPVDNALTLVYIDSDTASFVKYINHKATPVCQAHIHEQKDGGHPASAFDLAVTYYEPVSDTQSERAQTSENGDDVSSSEPSDDESGADEEPEQETDEEEQAEMEEPKAP